VIVLDNPHGQPTDGVMTRSASCGKNRFSVTIMGGEGPLSGRLSISINGKEWSRREEDEALRSFPPDAFLIDTAISECSRAASPSARFEIRLIHKPWLGNKEQWLDFWVSPKGRVSNIRIY
jgi:hypothetical protein